MLAGMDLGVWRRGPACAWHGQPVLQGGSVWERLPRMDPHVHGQTDTWSGEAGGQRGQCTPWEGVLGFRPPTHCHLAPGKEA